MFSKGTTQAKNIDLYLNNTAGIFPYELLEHTDYFLYLKDNPQRTEEGICAPSSFIKTP